MPARKRKATTQPTSYEQILQELEATVARLESGDLSLEEAMSAYEQGVALAAQSQKLLDTAEQRIEELRETGEE